METILITSKKRINVNEINARLAVYWRVEGAAGNRLVIQEKESRVYVHLDLLGTDAVASACGDDKKTDRLYVDYSDVGLVKRVIVAIGDQAALTIDNDFGTVLPGNEFVARIKSDPNWNWRDQ
jgi:hypothetical protein